MQSEYRIKAGFSIQAEYQFTRFDA